MSALPPVSTDGYILPGKGPVVLLFHGFTGSPYDLKPLALALEKHGCEVRVPLLAGHGSSSSSLLEVNSDQWLKQGMREIAALDKTRPLILGGISMGALIAILLVKESRAQALALFSPAIVLSLAAELIITAVKLGILSGQGSLPKLGGGSDIADPIARKKCPSYKDMPIFGIMQFDALRLQAKKELGHIDIPTFMAFGKLDSAINVQSSRQTILNEIRGPIVSKLYARSKHVISLDYDRDLLAKDLWHFINAHLGY